MLWTDLNLGLPKTDSHPFPSEPGLTSGGCVVD